MPSYKGGNKEMLTDYLEKIKVKANVTVLRAVVYARFSSDNQRSESIDAQLRAVKKFAGENNIIIVNEYIDEAQSAKRDDREAFQKMMKDSKSGEWQLVIVHKLDRFARNRFDSATYRVNLRRNGKYLISAVEQFDDSPESAMMEAMIESMAEYYSKNLARETMKGLTENALKGKHCGGIPPLGFKLNSSNFYEIDDYEAQGVRYIFRLFLEGKSYNEIISEVNDAGYRTKRKQLFTKNSVCEILRNEKYTGTFVYNKMQSRDEITGKRSKHKYKPENEIIRVKNAMPLIISSEDWEKVQDILESRRKTYGNHAKEKYLLSGKVKCGECGENYIGKSTTNSRGTKYVCYVCNRKRNPNYKCHNTSVNRDYLEDVVVKSVMNFIKKFNNDYLTEIKRRYEKDIENRNDKEIKTLQRKIVSIDAEMQKTCKCYIDSSVRGAD